MRKGLVFGLMAIMFATFAFAGEVVVEAVKASPDLFTAAFWKVVGMGALSGVLATVVGWLKNKKVEKFNAQQAGPSILIGAIIGGVAAYKGENLQEAEAMLTALPVWTGLVSFINMGWKLVYRRFISKKTDTEVVVSSDPS